MQQNNKSQLQDKAMKDVKGGEETPDTAYNTLPNQQ